MQIKQANPATLAKKTDFLATPSLIVFSEREAKKEKWLAALPTEVRERVTAVRDRYHARAAAHGSGDPVLGAGARIAVPGRARGEEDVFLAVLPAEAEAFFLLEFARDSLKDALQTDARTLRVILAGDDRAEEVADALGAAAAARVFPMPTYGKRKQKEKPFLLEKIELVTGKKKIVDAFARGYASGEGTNLARELATLPPNYLDPAQYGEMIRKLCKENGISCKFHSRAELKKMGAGAFTAVDRGNPNSAGGIYELEYKPKQKHKRVIHLAGKGICFDTGGYDVKTGGHMISMKGDMQGSAVALATLVTAAKLKLPFHLKAFLAVTENHISPEGYKADEVVTALNGLSIEVVNTDAEGRMVLADTLTLASRGKPHCLIDFATLTGAAVRALGTKYAAGFTNREALHERILRAGRRSGERVWTFPTDPSYAKALESKIADTIQCVRAGGPDHILAAVFLGRFIEEGTPWVHVDLACSENEGGLGHVDSLYTGFGVRWALEFIQRA